MKNKEEGKKHPLFRLRSGMLKRFSDAAHAAAHGASRHKASSLILSSRICDLLKVLKRQPKASRDGENGGVWTSFSFNRRCPPPPKKKKKTNKIY